MRVPGVTKRDQETDGPVLSTDFLPTILELAKIDLPSGTVLDGESLVPQLNGEMDQPTRPLVWHYPHYHGSEWTPGAAIRVGDWKLIEFYEFDDAELYNLSADPGEQKNLAIEEPNHFLKLREQLRQWQKNLHAKMPQPNPAWVAE